MRYILAIVNHAVGESHPDQVFSDMDKLIAYVNENYLEWTSLLVTVLPDA